MKLKLTLLCVVSALILVFAGCSQTDETTDEETAAEIPEFNITIEVVGEDPVEITNKDAAEIGISDMQAAIKDGDVLLEVDTWTGIRLVDLLDYLGVESFTVISVEAADGYSQELEPDRIDEQGCGLAWMVNGELLEEDSGPIQLVNHGRGSKWWIKQVARITVIK